MSITKVSDVIVVGDNYHFYRHGFVKLFPY